MRDVALLLGSALLAFVTTAGLSMLFSWILRRRGEPREVLRLQEIESLDDLLSEAKKRDLTEEEKTQALSDLMALVMSSRSRRNAENYVELVRKRLHEDVQNCLDQSELVLKERFEGRTNAEAHMALKCSTK